MRLRWEAPSGCAMDACAWLCEDALCEDALCWSGVGALCTRNESTDELCGGGGEESGESQLHWQPRGASVWQAIDTSCERRGRADSNEESGESRVQEAPKLQRRSNARGDGVEVERRCANTKASVYAVRPRSGAQRPAENRQHVRLIESTVRRSVAGENV